MISWCEAEGGRGGRGRRGKDKHRVGTRVEPQVLLLIALIESRPGPALGRTCRYRLTEIDFEGHSPALTIGIRMQRTFYWNRASGGSDQTAAMKPRNKSRHTDKMDFLNPLRILAGTCGSVRYVKVNPISSVCTGRVALNSVTSASQSEYAVCQSVTQFTVICRELAVSRFSYYRRDGSVESLSRSAG
ncbi:hypothetical protein BaRGS_00038776 [Batillaria attramentaria]|uniref:Uncharacterized protein n=1 Tax=Batillaria attramentaria TaxID=370345 RepID=A0ABD0J4S6_9CAEN